MKLNIREISQKIGICETLTKNYLCLAEFERKRVANGKGNKFVYELTEGDLKLLKKIITSRVRWFRNKKVAENV